MNFQFQLEVLAQIVICDLTDSTSTSFLVFFLLLLMNLTYEFDYLKRVVFPMLKKNLLLQIFFLKQTKCKLNSLNSEI